jgi:hypothetical protein
MGAGQSFTKPAFSRPTRQGVLDGIQLVGVLGQVNFRLDYIFKSSEDKFSSHSIEDGSHRIP